MKNFIAGLAILVLLVIVVFVSFSPSLSHYSTFFATILGVATFIFGFFISFSVSDRKNRIDKIRENDSLESSSLLSAYFSAKELDIDFGKKVQSCIDSYLMATLDYKIDDYYKTQNDYNELFSLVSSYDPKTEREKILCSNMISNVDKIFSCRKNTIGLIEDKLSSFEWMVSAFLTIIILISLAAMNSGGYIAIIIILFLSLTLSLLLSLLYSLDNLAWKEEDRIFEPYAMTFEAMGLVRYYPDSFITENRVKKHIGKEYRIGTLPNPYPDMSGKEIKLIKPSK